MGVQEDRFSGGRLGFWTPSVGEVVLQGMLGGLTEQGEALLATLALYAQATSLEVKVCAVEAHGLCCTQSSRVHDLEEGTVARADGGRRVRRGEERLDLLDGEDARGMTPRASLPQARDWRELDATLLQEPAEEGARRGELALDSGRAQLALVEGCEPCAQVEGLGLLGVLGVPDLLLDPVVLPVQVCLENQLFPWILRYP